MFINLALICLFSITSFLIAYFDENNLPKMFSHFAILTIFAMGMVHMNLGHPVFNKWANIFLFICLICLLISHFATRHESKSNLKSDKKNRA